MLSAAHNSRFSIKKPFADSKINSIFATLVRLNTDNHYLILSNRATKRRSYQQFILESTTVRIQCSRSISSPHGRSAMVNVSVRIVAAGQAWPAGTVRAGAVRHKGASRADGRGGHPPTSSSARYSGRRGADQRRRAGCGSPVRFERETGCTCSTEPRSLTPLLSGAGGASLRSRVDSGPKPSGTILPLLASRDDFLGEPG